MPKISDMLFGSEPKFPPSGCHRCDGIRKLTGKPGAYCLKHDPTIIEEERKRYGVAYESVKEIQSTKGMHNAKNQ